MSALLTLAAMGAILLVVGVSVERGKGVKELALIASLGAVAAAGRVLFVAIPSVSPVTVMCLVTGATLGARAGAAVGALAALISNTLLGHGPWTPAQMALWAVVGVSGALLRPAATRVYGLVVLGAAWGFAFGWGMNLWFLATFGPEVSPEAFLLTAARSLPFDVAGAAGNAVLALVIGPALVRMLSRVAGRIRVRAPAPAPT
ncbi:MAG: ECF transporter S component [Thermoleophilia bacterium]|nr:ECF transporter S component [Thermoleophilia bacterium]